MNNVHIHVIASNRLELRAPHYRPLETSQAVIRDQIELWTLYLETVYPPESESSNFLASRLLQSSTLKLARKRYGNLNEINEIAIHKFELHAED